MGKLQATVISWGIDFRLLLRVAEACAVLRFLVLLFFFFAFTRGTGLTGFSIRKPVAQISALTACCIRPENCPV